MYVFIGFQHIEIKQNKIKHLAHEYIYIYI